LPKKSIHQHEDGGILRRLHYILKLPVSRVRRFELGGNVRHRFEEAQQQTALDRVIHILRQRPAHDQINFHAVDPKTDPCKSFDVLKISLIQLSKIIWLIVSAVTFCSTSLLGQDFVWTQTTAPNTNWYSVASSSDGTKLVAVTLGEFANGGIYISTDSGTTWTLTSIRAADFSSRREPTQTFPME
jgi:hypothetical protein